MYSKLTGWRGPLRVTAWTLIAAVAIGSFPRAARADTSDKELVGLTKCTIYGGLLGGLLGLTGALVVKEGSRDDVVRWGVAIGALSGFGYGIFKIIHGSDDLATGPGRINLERPGRTAMRPDDRDLVHGWRLGSAGFDRGAEVAHDGFEKEDGRIREADHKQVLAFRQAAPGLDR